MRKLGIAGLAVALSAAGAAVFGASCGQTPVNVAIHTFEGAQKVAVVCLEVNDSSGNALPKALPVQQNRCAPVPPNVVGSPLPFHLISVVTQTTRGELAVVDLTAGYVVDEDKSTPGVNFIPVGKNPTDVTVSPDATWTFVASAAPTKPAIYAIPSDRLLGDTTATVSVPLLLTDLLACSLPQPPLALAVSTIPGASAVDAGGGADAGAPTAYTLLALLGGQGRTPARLVAIDPATFTNNAHPGALPPCRLSGATTLSGDVPASWTPGPAWPDGVPYADASTADSEPSLGPASLCMNTISDGGTRPTGSDAAPPQGSPADASGEDASDAGAEEASTEDGGGEGSTGAEAGSLDGGFALSLGPVLPPSPVSMVMRDDSHLLYVADATIPIIHIIDVTDPTAPKELEPLLATSLSEPSRVVQLGSGLALSPPTRDYKRYLYAIDYPGGSLMVFDVTSPSSPHVPMQRPHQELNPLAPPDRLTFAAPVSTVAFVQHDWPLQIPGGSTVQAYQGLLCNPNPNAHPSPTAFDELGAYYRADQAGIIQVNGTVESLPYRLRGIFAFATLTNGTMVTIDVDDWDAPCRRPDPMSAGPIADRSGIRYDGGLTNSLDIPQPAAGPPDASTYLDPYHAPLTYQSAISESAAVTLEPFYPVSAPHRVRSGFLVRNDPTSGVHVPTIAETPQLQDVNGTPVTTSGPASATKPLLLPTVLDKGFIDPSQIQNPTEPDPNLRTSFTPVITFPDPQNLPPPGIRLSFEDPTAQQNQDWTVTYEGVLPSPSQIVADIGSTDGYKTLTLTTMGANLCALGIEDWTIGTARAGAALAEMESRKLISQIPTGSKEDPRQWTADYVEIADDILPETDPYWQIPSPSQDNMCWAVPSTLLPTNENPFVDPPNTSAPSPRANARYQFCQAVYGAPGTNPDLSVSRDLPILEAYKDHLVVGRFDKGNGQLELTTNRTIDDGSKDSRKNRTNLEIMQCCFHSQASFIKIRTGGEWVAVGQDGVGLLHHVVATPSSNAADKPRCVLSCDPRDALLNARSFDVPWTEPGNCTDSPATATERNIERNSVLAMRNPMFSYVTWSACGPFANPNDHTLTVRDLSWKFSIGGAFSPLTIALSGTTGAQVSPQSMLFIDSLGQLAVVDGAQQGLVLIDLNTVAFSNNYF